MTIRSANRVFVFCVGSLLLTGQVFAVQGDSDGQKGPEYFNLRYDDDFSYLDGEPGSYEEDFFDPVKNMHFDIKIDLGEDWVASMGGEYRFRLEYKSNEFFGLSPRTSDTYHLHRFLLHFDVKYQDWFRVFVQGIHAFDEDRNKALRGTDENRLDLQQLFLDFTLLGDTCPLTVRIGRQELHYGNIRYVSSAEWDNVRQRFDAVKLFAHGENWDVDVWYAKPVVVQRDGGDDYNEDVDFYGLYTTYKGWENHGLDMYFFALDDTGATINPNGAAGDRDVYTVGARFWSQHGPWDFETELAYQWGDWAGDDISAWSWSLYGGYTIEDCPWTPRIGAGFDYVTGDDDPFDSDVETFNQLFADGHAHFGALDLFGRQNLVSANVGVTAWPIADTVSAGLHYYTFWLEDDADALYTAGGAPAIRDVTGGSGEELGHEIDLSINWKVDTHSTVMFGWSHFFNDNFIESLTPGDDPDFLYLQYQFKF